MKTVYVSIGNSDDKLSQLQWSQFHLQTHLELHAVASEMHGAWTSGPTSAWQNACWCIEIEDELVEQAKLELKLLARQFRQDSIAWAEVPVTEFIKPVAS